VRPRRLAFVALLTLLTLFVSGCRAVRAVTVTPEEHAAYKPTRTRATLEQRMKASEEYLARYPDGAFAAEVRRAYLRSDEAFWASKRGSTPGLEAYLATLPTGPHAKMARRELDARRAASIDLLGRGARKTEARLADAAAARTRAREALGTWVRRLTDPSVFGSAIASAPADFVVAWSLGLPQPKCAPTPNGGRRCRKLVTETFTIPREGERQLVLEIEVEESAEGRVCGASMSGPDLFRRWEEAGTTAPGALDGSQISRDVEALIRSTIETRPGQGACERTALSEEAYVLKCGALEVTVGHSGRGDDDGVYVSTAYPCSSP
jgi:hypothetical protein